MFLATDAQARNVLSIFLGVVGILLRVAFTAAVVLLFYFLLIGSPGLDWR